MPPCNSFTHGILYTMSTGILIVFDGIDGAGKTTQVSLLVEALAAAGEAVVVSKEPTDGTWGRRLRESAISGRLPAEEELQHFLNDRQEHLEQVVRPALAAGKIVILDRYFYSSIAYQGIRGGDVDKLEETVRQGIEVPDIAFIMDLAPELAAYRIAKRDGKANEFERIEDLERVGKLYSFVGKNDPVAKIIDASISVKAIHKEIIEILIEGPLRKHCDCNCEDPFWCVSRMTNTCPWPSLARKLRTTLASA